MRPSALAPRVPLTTSLKTHNSNACPTVSAEGFSRKTLSAAQNKVIIFPELYELTDRSGGILARRAMVVNDKTAAGLGTLVRQAASLSKGRGAMTGFDHRAPARSNAATANMQTEHTMAESRFSVRLEQATQRDVCNLFGDLLGRQPAIRVVPTRDP